MCVPRRACACAADVRATTLLYVCVPVWHSKKSQCPSTSKVSALVYFLYKVTIGRTLENLTQHLRKGAHTKS